MSLKKLMQKITNLLPREMFGNFQTVVIEKGSVAERNKHFAGGPDRYEFELISKQNNVFAFWIGKSSKINDDRFEGPPSDKKIIEGKKKIKRIILSGQKYRLQEGDRWLIKIRAESFADRGDNTLEIYCTKLEE